MKAIKFTIILALIFMTGLTACKKNGTGGDAQISMTVKHHERIIPATTIYIKYDAKEFPGADVSLYDNSVTADANGFAKFENLLKGNYYVYGVGFDSSIGETVRGGLGVEIKKRTENKEVTVHVVE